VREVEVAEEVLVQSVCVLAGAGEPAGDSRLLVAEDAFSRGRIQPFSQGGEHHCDLVRGGFQAI